MMQATDPDAIPKEVSLEERVRLLEMQNKFQRSWSVVSNPRRRMS